MSNEFRYYMHEGPDAFSLEVAGDVSDNAARQLDQIWRTASSVNREQSLIVDLSYVTNMEEAGRAMLRRWYANGAQLVARLPHARAIVESITGQGPELVAAVPRRQTWLPFRLAALWALGLAVWFAPVAARAADLKPETVQTWEQYVRGVTARTKQQLASGAFLSFDNSPDQGAMLRSGEILVSPAGPNIPLKIPSGLIHDWVGTVFIRDVRIPQVLQVLRDYASYKEVYHPNVVESRPIVTGNLEDRFSLLIVNKSVIAGGALDSDYRTSYNRMDDRHWYSIGEATRVQEVEEYGSPSQHSLPENKGAGIIWRLCSVTRFEERDGGVYIEVEAMALSRDVPSSLRWLVDPIVRRISRSSVLTSLQQTKTAVLANASGSISRSPAHPPCTTGAKCVAATTGSSSGPVRSFR